MIGAARFNGSNLVQELLRIVEQLAIIGLDNMNDYYDVSNKDYCFSEIKRKRHSPGFPVGIPQ